MAFRMVNQLKGRKSLWTEVLLYFAICLLIVSILCYFIFSIKNSSQRKSLEELDLALESVGTEQQKGLEKEVVGYERKINDYMTLLKNRKFVSVLFSLMEQQTFFNVWFDKFSMNRRDAEVDLSGKTDNMSALSRQVATFENNENVKKITVLNSKLGDLGITEFNLNLIMDSKLFASSFQSSLLETASPSSGEVFNREP